MRSVQSIDWLQQWLFYNKHLSTSKWSFFVVGELSIASVTGMLRNPTLHATCETFSANGERIIRVCTRAPRK